MLTLLRSILSVRLCAMNLIEVPIVQLQCDLIDVRSKRFLLLCCRCKHCENGQRQGAKREKVGGGGGRFQISLNREHFIPKLLHCIQYKARFPQLCLLRCRSYLLVHAAPQRALVRYLGIMHDIDENY